ncbi:hypothetical protein Tco_0630959 [Tanacetum coccineum]
MGCLPRSACLGSRCLDPSQGFIDTGESLEIWNYKCASTVAVRKYSSDGERAIPNGILGLLEKSLNLELKRRNSITMLKKHGFDLESWRPLCFGLVDHSVLIGLITNFN